MLRRLTVLVTTLIFAGTLFSAAASARMPQVPIDGGGTGTDPTPTPTPCIEEDPIFLGKNYLVSQGIGGLSEHDSWEPSISANGRFVAFYSWANNLVPGDSNMQIDVFVRDMVLRKTTIVSVSSTGEQGNNPSLDPVISPDGRYVAFPSTATNLTPDGEAGGYFLHDRSTKKTILLPGGGASFSADGRYIAMTGHSIIPEDTSGQTQIYIWDRTNNSYEVASVSNSGEFANGETSGASLSADGRRVAFTSKATNMVPSATDGFRQVYLRDLDTDTTTLISKAPLGGAGNHNSHDPTISGDGRHVGFRTDASNLLLTGNGGSGGGVINDVDDGSLSGVPGFAGSMSFDGRYVTVVRRTPLDDLGSSDSRYTELHLLDRVEGTTKHVSHTPNFDLSYGRHNSPVVSADGRYVAYGTQTPNIVPDSGNTGGNGWDIIWWDAKAQVVYPDTEGCEEPDPEGAVDYVAFGDSITTGFSDFECDGSRLNSKHGCTGAPSFATPYPDLVAPQLGDSHDRVGIWGYTVQDAVNTYLGISEVEGGWEPQLRAVDRATEYVTGALGINDMHFSDWKYWMVACLDIVRDPATGDRTNCETAANAAVARTPFDVMFDVLGDARARGARVFVTLYYNPYSLTECPELGGVADIIVHRVNEELANHSFVHGLETVDFYTPFLGHGAEDPQPYVFGTACTVTGALEATVPNWVLNGFSLSAAAEAAQLSVDPHPNGVGTQVMANAILERIP